jgi:apolipoprotein N-acyltransferase
LFGSPAIRFYPDQRPYLLNSAYLLSPDGQLLGRYDKQHLVPFGEYIPFKSSFLSFLDKLVEGIGDFEAGPGPTVLTLTPKPQAAAAGIQGPTSRSVRFGAVICYEVIFPNLVRKFAANGAEFLVTVSNDAWFGHSIGPWQHFQMARMRALELGRPLLRSTNNGVTAVVNASGDVEAMLPQFTRDVLTSKVTPTQGETPYARAGIWPVWSLTLLDRTSSSSGAVSGSSNGLLSSGTGPNQVFRCQSLSSPVFWPDAFWESPALLPGDGCTGPCIRLTSIADFGLFLRH